MPVQTKAWDRRRFLRAAGVFGAATTVLRHMPVLRAADTEFPRRLLLVSTGNGTVTPRWRSNGSGAAFVSGGALPQLRGPILAPLDPFRAKLLLLDGVDIAPIFGNDGKESANKGHAAASALWTGVSGGGARLEGEDVGAWPNNHSLDVHLANQLSRGSAFKTYQLASFKRPNDTRAVLSYGANGAPQPAQWEPLAAYQQLFAGFSPADADESAPSATSPAAVPVQPDGQRRMLSLVHGELQRLRRELPSDDRYRLDAHLDAVHALEDRLVGGGASDTSSLPVVNGCSLGDAPSTYPYDTETIPQRIDDQIDIITAALSCDRTRFMTYALLPENSIGTASYVDGWRGGGIHDTSHEQEDPSPAVAADAAESMTALNYWAADRFAKLLQRLDSVEEAPGQTLLDSTLIVWGTAMCQGGTHSNRGNPFVVVAGARSSFSAGRYVRYGSFDPSLTNVTGAYGRRDHGCQASNRLLVSICRDFGLTDTNTFGDPRFTGPLPGLLGG